MQIAMVGTGYVGLVTGACFADVGHNVYCLDIDERKIAALRKGTIPIFEPGLEQLVTNNFERGCLHFTTDAETALKMPRLSSLPWAHLPMKMVLLIYDMF